MTQDPSGTQAPAGLNGNSPSSPARQTADGVAAIAGMLPQAAQGLAGMLSQLPQATGQAVAQSIPRQLCAQCVIARLTWDRRHEQDVAEATARYMEAAEEATSLGVPLQRPPESFLPERLQPGQPEATPQLQAGITIVNGTLVCAEHVPGVPGKPGGKALLIAHGPLSSGLLAGLAT